MSFDTLLEILPIFVLLSSSPLPSCSCSASDSSSDSSSNASLTPLVTLPRTASKLLFWISSGPLLGPI